MANALQLITEAIRTGPGAGGAEYHWQDLLAALQSVISAPLSSDAEHLLLSLLRFDGQLRLDATSEFPHSMPPEDMLKSLAVQALGKWAGLTHLREMERVQATTPSPALECVVRAVIQQARRSEKFKIDEPEEVAESSPERSRPTVPRLLGRDRGMSFLPGRRVRRRDLQPA
jgi:hypothetical protein